MKLKNKTNCKNSNNVIIVENNLESFLNDIEDKSSAKVRLINIIEYNPISEATINKLINNASNLFYSVKSHLPIYVMYDNIYEIRPYDPFRFDSHYNHNYIKFNCNREVIY